MQESIGGTQIFAIVIVLILLFTGIMAFTINHSNAFSVKDQIVSSIEKNNGIDITTDIDGGSNLALEEIVEIIDKNSYRATGKCPESKTNYEVQGFDRSGRHSLSNESSSFCLVKVSTGNSDTGEINSHYYQVVLFYSLDLPVIKTLFNFKMTGETKLLYD